MTTQSVQDDPEVDGGPRWLTIGLGASVIALMLLIAYAWNRSMALPEQPVLTAWLNSSLRPALQEAGVTEIEFDGTSLRRKKLVLVAGGEVVDLSRECRRLTGCAWDSPVERFRIMTRGGEYIVHARRPDEASSASAQEQIASIVSAALEDVAKRAAQRASWEPPGQQAAKSAP